MSTDYTHFSQLAFDRLFARGAPGSETLVINSLGVFVGPISFSGALSVKSISTGSNATFAGTLRLSALGTGIAHVSSTGVISSSLILNADISSSAAIVGTKIVSASTSASGVITTGTQSIAGNKSLFGNFLPDAISTRNIGSTSLRWNQIWGDSLRMGGSQIGSTNERISAQNSLTATTSLDNRLAYLRAETTGNTSVTTGVLKALILNARRTISSNTTDSAGDNGALALQCLIATGGAVYTNTNTAIGNGSLIFEIPSITGGGSAAISRFGHILFKTDNAATGTRKSYINFGTISGATNNAYISDNDAFTGNYFINSTSTNASVLGGALTVGVASTSVHTLNTAVAVTANAGTIALPVAGVVGYITMSVNGTNRKIPYYAN